MGFLEGMSVGLETVIGWLPLLVLFAGVLFGVLAGAMPGLSPSTAVALLVPFSYTMPPSLALVMLTAVYLASNYGGSITAILLNTPGTPAAAVTSIDGYALTKKGKAGKSLGIALVASTIGGMIGVVILTLFAVPLASVALKFGAPEYFALALFGLATVASLGTGNLAKAMLAIIFGLLITTIGIDPISGVSRFTFGVEALYDGFSLIPALIGLFALSVVFENASKEVAKSKALERLSAKFPEWKEIWRIKMSVAKSSFIGTIIGIFPGAGATIASFISYGHVQKK